MGLSALRGAEADPRNFIDSSERSARLGTARTGRCGVRADCRECVEDRETLREAAIGPRGGGRRRANRIGTLSRPGRRRPASHVPVDRRATMFGHPVGDATDSSRAPQRGGRRASRAKAEACGNPIGGGASPRAGRGRCARWPRIGGVREPAFRRSRIAAPAYRSGGGEKRIDPRPRSRGRYSVMPSWKRSGESGSMNCTPKPPSK